MRMAAEWITPAQAAQELGITTQWVRALCDTGRLRHERTPLGRLVHRASLERYRREREARQTNGK